jgi:GNAT superfamily N-acetyltransferase
VPFRLEWRGAFDDRALNELHAEAFEHRVLDDGWAAQVAAHSLGWVCAWGEDGDLLGFVNVPWDGACHAFIVDAMVSARAARQGIGTGIVTLATDQARAAGCEWLHVDFEEHHRSFYLDACGFEPAPAGVINLKRTKR